MLCAQLQTTRKGCLWCSGYSFRPFAPLKTPTAKGAQKKKAVSHYPPTNTRPALRTNRAHTHTPSATHIPHTHTHAQRYAQTAPPRPPCFYIPAPMVRAQHLYSLSAPSQPSPPKARPRGRANPVHLYFTIVLLYNCNISAYHSAYHSALQ